MLPAGATFTCCDILDASSVTNAVDFARQLVMAIGFAYEGSPRARRSEGTNAVANYVNASHTQSAARGLRSVVDKFTKPPAILTNKVSPSVAPEE